jgi:hypothetical protein
MFENQTVELLPARTTMSCKNGKNKKRHGGNNTAVAFNVIFVEARGNAEVNIDAEQTATATAGNR